MSKPLPTVYSGVDWFTVTTGDTSAAREAWRLAGTIAKKLESDGNALQEWRGNGYSGLACSHFRYGLRDGDCLVELQGHLAAPYWRDFYPLAKNVPRIDLAVDVEFPQAVQDLAHSAYQAPPGGTVLPGVKVSKTFMVSTGGGQTCYLGSPKSERRGRLYDKGIQSGGDVPGIKWRYEVQERDDMGRATASALYSHHDLHSAVSAIVHRYYRARGIEPWFRADGECLPLQPGKPETDWQRTEYWLASQVAPAVDRYCALGYRDAILRALGLSDGQSDIDRGVETDG